MNKTTKKVSAANVQGTAADTSKKGFKESLISRMTAGTVKWQSAVALLFFVVIWALLAFYESALLQRTESLSLFLFDWTFFDSMLSAPAGILSYAGSFLVQFFHYPPLGAAIYVLLLYAVYRLIIKVFELPGECTILALIPVVALLASNTQLGYWLFYLKMPGYYYMALSATLLTLLAMWAYKGLGRVARVLLLCAMVVVGYPLMGVYALVAALLTAVMGIALSVGKKERLVFPVSMFVVTLLLVVSVPRIYYGLCYTSVALENVYTAGVPAVQWNADVVANVEHVGESFWHRIYVYWIPFVLLLLSISGFTVSFAFRKKSLCPAVASRVMVLSAAALALLFLVRYWYNDANFRIENKQNVAIWEEDWNAVTEYAKECDEPTRQIVLNKNLALLVLGRAGNEMFAYPDGGVLPVAAVGVHMTHTDGHLIYYHFGRFNYSYRWCMENSVEYGWRHEYLKSAVRSMLLSGEYRLASRYISILKKTMFHKAWAEEMEAFVKEPSLIASEPSFDKPLKLSCYNDNLGVDEVVEKYVMDVIDASNTMEFSEKVLMTSLTDALACADYCAFADALAVKEEITPEYVEASLMMSLIKKDSRRFWSLLNLFINNHLKGVDANSPASAKLLPRHYQEAALLFMVLDKGKTVQVGEEFLNTFVSRTPGGVESNFMRFQNSVARMRDELRKTYPDISEDRLNAVIAARLKEEFGKTYYYYYFFVKKIMTY